MASLKSPWMVLRKTQVSGARPSPWNSVHSLGFSTATSQGWKAVAITADSAGQQLGTWTTFGVEGNWQYYHNGPEQERILPGGMGT